MLRRLVDWSDSHALTRGLRRRLGAAPGVAQTISALDRRRVRRYERVGAVEERSKRRWREALSNPGLTWGVEVSGAAAIEAAERYGVFGPGRTVLEIGPGYGRLLASALGGQVEFDHYVGVEIAAQHVEHLQARFEDPRLVFVHGDIESVELATAVDGVYSFLVFKHLYPSFQIALENVAQQLRPDGRVVFDLIEGSRRYFHSDGSTYVREYGRDEVVRIVTAVGLELVAIDQVEHAPGRTRMLVVAGRPGPGRAADEALASATGCG